MIKISKTKTLGCFWLIMLCFTVYLSSSSSYVSTSSTSILGHNDYNVKSAFSNETKSVSVPSIKSKDTVNLIYKDEPVVFVKTYLMYVNADSVWYRSEPVINDETAIGLLSSGHAVKVIEEDNQWCKCVIDNEVVYIKAELLVEDYEATEASIKTSTSDAPEMVLNSRIGRVSGPSGEETYYNLNMTKCIERMHSFGYDYEYWIREDGVKMFGEYVMVAADFNIRPLGTIVETSLGLGCVVDTGEFIEENPTGIDVAVNW